MVSIFFTYSNYRKDETSYQMKREFGPVRLHFISLDFAYIGLVGETKDAFLLFLSNVVHASISRQGNGFLLILGKKIHDAFFALTSVTMTFKEKKPDPFILFHTI